jgi:hypothetical protein
MTDQRITEKRLVISKDIVWKKSGPDTEGKIHDEGPAS